MSKRNFMGPPKGGQEILKKTGKYFWNIDFSRKMFYCLIIVFALLGNLPSGLFSSSTGIWTDKNSYCVGETITISWSVDSDFLVDIILYKPDGQSTYIVKDGPHSGSRTGIAGYPLGVRNVVLYIWGSAADSCKFEVKDCGGPGPTPPAPSCEEWLIVNCNVGGYKLYIDGEYILTEDGDGECGVKLPKGRYTVKLKKEGCSTVTKSVEIVCGRSTYLNVTMSCREEEGTIKVYVKDDSGKKLKDAKIYLDGSYKGKTNSSGEYTIRDVEPGSHTVKATKSGYEDDSERVYVDAGETETVYLTLGGGTEGEAPEIEVTWHVPKKYEIGKGGDLYFTVRNKGGDAKGEDKLYISGDLISQGNFSLQKGKSRTSGWKGDFKVKEKYVKNGYVEITFYVRMWNDYGSDTYEETRKIPVEVEEEEGTIKVYVKDDSGKKLKDAKIYLDGSYEGKTNSSGEYTIRDVEPGSHTVKATKSGYEDDSERVYVDAGETETVYLTLGEEEGTIKVYVKDDSGKKLKDAKVYLDGSYKGKTDSSGEYTICNVEPGSHTVKATKSGYEDDSERVYVDAGETETVYLTLGEEKGLTYLTEKYRESGEKYYVLQVQYKKKAYYVVDYYRGSSYEGSIIVDSSGSLVTSKSIARKIFSVPAYMKYHFPLAYDIIGADPDYPSNMDEIYSRLTSKARQFRIFSADCMDYADSMRKLGTYRDAANAANWGATVVSSFLMPANPLSIAVLSTIVDVLVMGYEEIDYLSIRGAFTEAANEMEDIANTYDLAADLYQDLTRDELRSVETVEMLRLTKGGIFYGLWSNWEDFFGEFRAILSYLEDNISIWRFWRKKEKEEVKEMIEEIDSMKKQLIKDKNYEIGRQSIIDDEINRRISLLRGENS